METEKKTVIETDAERYATLPKDRKQKEFKEAWASHIKDLTRLLWTSGEFPNYEKQKAQIEKIQAELTAIVEENSARA